MHYKGDMMPPYQDQAARAHWVDGMRFRPSAAKGTRALLPR
jgi:hypothetical protein